MRSGRRWAAHALRGARIRAGQSRVRLEPVAAARARRPDPDARFDQERAFALLRAQCDLGPRAPGTRAHVAARDLILREVAAHADAVAVQSWRQRVARGAGAGQTVPLWNVLARFEGSGAARGAGTPGAPPDLVLATHWDTRPVADQDPDPSRRTLPVPGASDGASGVAVLLELARVLATRRPAAATVLAFFDGEDLGEHYYGSRLFARVAGRAAYAGWRARRGIVVDMIGGAPLRCTTELHSIRAAPALWEAVHRSAAALGVARHFHGAPGTINDDHVFLTRAGIPSVLLIDYGYPHWHTTHDVPEHCAPASLGVVGRVLEHLLLDGTPEAPGGA